MIVKAFAKGDHIQLARENQEIAGGARREEKYSAIGIIFVSWNGNTRADKTKMLKS